MLFSDTYDTQKLNIYKNFENFVRLNMNYGHYIQSVALNTWLCLNLQKLCSFSFKKKLLSFLVFEIYADKKRHGRAGSLF